MADMPRQVWIDFVRGMAIQAMLYRDRRDLMATVLPEWEILDYHYRHEWEHPSYMVIRSGNVTEVHLNGTQNPAQGLAHLWGYLALPDGGGAVNRTWRNTCDRFLENLQPYLPDKDDAEKKLVWYGHSYGAGLVQIMAELESRNGRSPSRNSVRAMASPKPYTSLVPPLEHDVQILRSSNDIVGTYPFSFAPVIQLDPVLGIRPFPNHLAGWEHRGTVWTLKANGQHLPDDSGGEVDPAEDQSLEFNAHMMLFYLWRLEEQGKLRGWQADGDWLKWKETFYAAINDSPNDELSGNLMGFPGYPFDTGASRVFSVFFASNGGVNVANPIKCTAHFESGGYGWSESYYYAPDDDGDRTFPAAQQAFESLMTNRAKTFKESVIYGRHYSHPAFRYAREGNTNEAWTDWTPSLGLELLAPSSTAGAAVEPPFVGYMIRAHAGPANSRTLLVRPIPDTNFMSAAGVKVSHTALAAKIKVWFDSMVAQGCWAIKSVDKAQPVLPIIDVTTAALVAGEAYLNVPGMSLVKGDQVTISGGDPKWKILRGRHLVYSIPSSSTVHIKTDNVLPSGPCNAKIQKVVYHYPKMATFFDLRLTKRDTGRPIALGRGRR